MNNEIPVTIEFNNAGLPEGSIRLSNKAKKIFEDMKVNGVDYVLAPGRGWNYPRKRTDWIKPYSGSEGGKGILCSSPTSAIEGISIKMVRASTLRIISH